MAERSVKISGGKLAALREAKFIDQNDLATKAGLGVTRLGLIERAQTSNVFRATLVKLAAALGLSAEDLLSRIRPDVSPWDENVDPATQKPVPEIPLYDMSVAAGRWVDVIELAETRSLQQADDGRFRIRIAGDSMTPKYKAGDVVEFRTVRFGRDLLEKGKDYYVQRSDGTATFKKLRGDKDEQILLEAINAKKYRDVLIVPWQEVSRMARAVAIVQLLE